MTDSATLTSPAERSRALVVVPVRGVGSGRERPLAAFLTQLIASNRRLRAYRRAGRTEPGQGVKVYGERPEKASAGLDLSV